MKNFVKKSVLLLLVLGTFAVGLSVWSPTTKVCDKTKVFGIKVAENCREVDLINFH